MSLLSPALWSAPSHIRYTHVTSTASAWHIHTSTLASTLSAHWAKIPNLVNHTTNRRISEMYKKILWIQHEPHYTRYERGRYHPTNDPLLQTTRIQIIVAWQAPRETERWQTSIDNSRSSECGGGWASGTSMGRRFQFNPASTNYPSLSPLHGCTNDTPWRINIGQLGSYHTRGNNNTSRQTETSGNIEDGNKANIINWQRDHSEQCEEVWEELYHEGTFFETVHPTMVHICEST